MPPGEETRTYLDRARLDPHGLALDDLTRTRSWSDLAGAVAGVGGVLRHHGVGPGGGCALLMGNRVELVEWILGATAAGAWITPMNWHLTAAEVEHILDDSGAQLVITDPDLAEVARKAAGSRTVLVAGEDLDEATAAVDPLPVDLERPPGGTMYYTSGTTGRPKGVRRPPASTLGAHLLAAAASGRAVGMDGGGPHLVTGPLYHAAPLGFSLIDLHNGAPLVVMPRWDPSVALRLIMERRVHNTHLVPIMFVRLLALPPEEQEDFDPSSLNVVLHGAAPVSPAVKARMIDWWGEVITEYWGSTEGGVFTLVSASDWKARPGTVGRPVRTYEVFAVDGDTGERLPPGEVGVLYTRHLVTTEVFEYYGDPEKTAGAHLAPGAFTMGDVGWVDTDGFVYLSDRAADVIISGGVNIYPAEIESVLIEHPAVRDVAVIGVPDPEWGESVKAVVEVSDGHDGGEALAADIVDFARDRLAGYKLPRSVDFEDALPRHTTGKLFKRLLRDRYWAEGRRI